MFHFLVVNFVYMLRCKHVLWWPIVALEDENPLCCVCGCGPHGKTKFFWCMYCAPVCEVYLLAYHDLGVSSGCLVLPWCSSSLIFVFVGVVPIVLNSFNRIYFVPVVGFVVVCRCVLWLQIVAFQVVNFLIGVFCPIINLVVT